MSEAIRNQYKPDYVTPPGKTLLDKLKETGMTQVELARRMGRPKKTVNEIIQGKAPITTGTALKLERVLGIPARFWSSREQNYRHYLTRVKEETRLRKQVDWLRDFPVTAMIEKGWIEASEDKIKQLDGLLKFFGIAAPEQWKVQWDVIWNRSSVSFRKSRVYKSNLKAISAWLRQGEIGAQNIYCGSYDADGFRRTLEKIRHLTSVPPQIFRPELVRLCAAMGIAVVFVPQLPQSRVSGATRWLNPNKALIQLSLRYKTDDHLWFTFFHEAGHILLHGRREVFLENEDEDSKDLKEQEANKFAESFLIPADEYSNFLSRIKFPYLSKDDIIAFAAEVGIAPGILVGRLQHDGHIRPGYFNKLKRTLTWAS